MKDLREAAQALTDAEYVLALIDTTFESVPEVKAHHERMRAIAARLASLSTGDAGEPVAPIPKLQHRLQQKCSDWGAYWRAQDAHGVDLTVQQATELLADALGVEVEIKVAPQGADALDARRYQGLREIFQKSVGAGIEVNDQALVYEPVEPGEAVRLYWYPVTPVGFYESKADTLDEAVDAALASQEKDRG